MYVIIGLDTVIDGTDFLRNFLRLVPRLTKWPKRDAHFFF